MLTVKAVRSANIGDEDKALRGIPVSKQYCLKFGAGSMHTIKEIQSSIAKLQQPKMMHGLHAIFLMKPGKTIFRSWRTSRIFW